MGSELKDTEQEKSEQSIHNRTSEKSSSSSAIFKLITLVLLCFLVVKYGVPLMNQISESTGEAFDKKETAEPMDGAADSTTTATTSDISVEPESSIPITDGFQAWEAGVREQLVEWLGDQVPYELISIDVNDAKTIMEIRYKIGTAKKKIELKKDGFGDRFIYTEDDREFLVRPPQ